MTPPISTTEPYEISLRFHRALWDRVFRLEANAQKDDLFAASLNNLGHRRRHMRLVQAQRDDAGRFRNFLAAACIRV